MTNENPNYQPKYNLESTVYAGANIPTEFPEVVTVSTRSTSRRNPSRNASGLETGLMSEKGTDASETDAQNPLKKKSSLGKQVLMYGAIGITTLALIIGGLGYMAYLEAYGNSMRTMNNVFDGVSQTLK